MKILAILEMVAPLLPLPRALPPHQNARSLPSLPSLPFLPFPLLHPLLYQKVVAASPNVSNVLSVPRRPNVILANKYIF
jgi:hypothetical protein